MADYGVYALYEDVKAIDLDTSETSDDTLLERICVQASRDFEREANGRLFYPRHETRYYDLPYSTSEQRLDDDLLEVTTLTTNSGNDTVAAADYVLASGFEYGKPPYNIIKLLPNGTTTNWKFSGSAVQANSVSGYWGYVPHWTRGAWLSSGDTVSSLSGSSLTVSDVDGSDTLGRSPRFKYQQLLKISSGGNNEYLYITNKSIVTNILTVIRAVNGTSQLAGATGATIYIFQPDEAVVKATRRLAAWYYRQKDSSKPDTDRPIVTSGGIILPGSVPKDVTMAAKTFAWAGLS